MLRAKQCDPACPDVIYTPMIYRSMLVGDILNFSSSWFFLSCFVIFCYLFFLLSRFPPKCGAGSLSTPIKCCCCPEAITQQKKKGRHWQRRGMGPIILLTTDFIPRVKGLFSVTFTWFKSLAQLNQKSMKSFGYIFGLSCQHFKLGTIVFFLWFVLGHQLSKKVHREIMMAELWLGWNLTTHWKISPIAFMGLCRNGEYTRKTQNNLEEINI